MECEPQPKCDDKDEEEEECIEPDLTNAEVKCNQVRWLLDTDIDAIVSIAFTVTVKQCHT